MKNRFDFKRFIAGCGLHMLVFSLLTGAAVGSIPENIYVAAGEDKEICFNVPMRAELSGEAIGAISVKNKKGEENISLDLSDPFYVEADEETRIDAELSLLGIPVKTVSVNVMRDRSIIPCGNITGVTMETDGILVLGTGAVTDENGNDHSPARGKLEAGDIIKSINGEEIDDKEELARIVNNYTDGSFEMTIIRRGKEFKADIRPYKAVDGNRLGVWVRDSTQGLGTITCYDSENRSFAALGHGIYDVDTGSLMTVKDGSVTRAEVTGIKKGEKGSPGEVLGTLFKDDELGDILKNTECGLYGEIKETGIFFLEDESMPVGMRYEVKEGKAFILSDILDGKKTGYSINIESINRYGGRQDKSLFITITDERLLEKTGGIIQGMSGSPIIQNGKIIGAVTHVLVNSPERGYGIFIENMLDAAG
ncbi:MAG: SpoIVB peptidase [Lachnospiraceae bacterium]|nr:SpoIVB peptidase [Lachnospiraceae bacterium]